MTQYAIVKKLVGSDRAEVEVMRGTACGEECGSCEVCKFASKMRIEVGNAVYAQLGDRVEIETKSSRIYGAAFLVYVVPFILFFIGYGIASALGMTQGQSVLTSFAFFAAGVGAAVVIGRRKDKTPITYEITRIIKYGDNE